MPLKLKRLETISFFGFEYKRREFTCQEGFAGTALLVLLGIRLLTLYAKSIHDNIAEHIARQMKCQE
jgi:hypothetical protein